MGRKNYTIRAYALVFIGALLYVWIALGLVSGGVPTSGFLVGPGAVWFPIVIGLAVISSITLLMLAVAGLLIRHTENLKNAMLLSAWWGGLSLIIATAPGGMLWWSIIGFVLAYIGAGWLELQNARM